MLDVMLWADAWPHDVDCNGWPFNDIYLVYRRSIANASVSDSVTSEYPIAVFDANNTYIDGVRVSDMTNEDLNFHGLDRY